MTPTDDDGVGRVVHDAVSDVAPRPGVEEIRARTGRGARAAGPGGTWAWALGGTAVAATAATIAAVAVLGGSPGTSTSRPDVVAGGGTPSRTPTVTTPPREAALPVYFVGDTGRGPRLFREFHRAAAGDLTLDLAVERALIGNADDPDYGSPWPEGSTHQHAQLSGGVLSVDLSGPVVDRPAGMSAAVAEAALQQLVYTAQAAVQQTVPVTFLVDGRPARTVLGVPTDRPVPRGAADEVLAPVSVASPAEGATVQSPFTVEGQAAAFEANVQWELKQGDTVVRRGFTTAEECCTLAPYSFTVDAPAGTYTLVVHDEDPSGGEGLPPAEDTKQIEVE